MSIRKAVVESRCLSIYHEGAVIDGKEISLDWIHYVYGGDRDFSN